MPESERALEPGISAAAETLWELGPIQLTNAMLTMWISMAALLAIAWFATRRIRANPEAALIPAGLQNLVEAVVEAIEDLVTSSVGQKYASRLFAFGATFLIFITFANWVSLLPGIGTIWVPREVVHGGELTTVAVPLFRPATADINMTLALALTAFLVIHASGVAVQGPIGHIKEVSKLALLAPVFIIIELFVIVSLSFRLFGNLFAGEVLLNGPVLFGFALGHIPLIGVMFLLLEVLFGLIQGVIFFMLSMVFTGEAVAEPAHDEH